MYLTKSKAQGKRDRDVSDGACESGVDSELRMYMVRREETHPLHRRQGGAGSHNRPSTTKKLKRGKAASARDRQLPLKIKFLFIHAFTPPPFPNTQLFTRFFPSYSSQRGL